MGLRSDISMQIIVDRFCSIAMLHRSERKHLLENIQLTHTQRQNISCAIKICFLFRRKFIETPSFHDSCFVVLEWQEMVVQNESKPFEQSVEFNLRIIEVKKDALCGRDISQKSFERKYV